MSKDSHKMSEMSQYLANQMKLGDLIRMALDAAEWAGICYDLDIKNPKRVQAVRRVNYLWEALNIKVGDCDVKRQP